MKFHFHTGMCWYVISCMILPSWSNDGFMQVQKVFSRVSTFIRLHKHLLSWETNSAKIHHYFCCILIPTYLKSQIHWIYFLHNLGLYQYNVLPAILHRLGQRECLSRIIHTFYFMLLRTYKCFMCLLMNLIFRFIIFYMYVLFFCYYLMYLFIHFYWFLKCILFIYLFFVGQMSSRDAIINEKRHITLCVFHRNKMNVLPHRTWGWYWE